MISIGSPALVADKAVEIDGAVLQTRTNGEPSNPPVLLIMGVMSSMLWWPDRLCAELAARGRFVIRYDHRDTGLSTHYPQGQPGYSFDNLADDAIAILDNYGLGSAHIVGMSMGGMIAQEVVLRYPERVRTITLISTSPLGVKDLPRSTEAYRKHSKAAEGLDWSDLAAIADFLRRDSAMLAGTRHPHDAEAASALIARDMARAPSFATATNHFMLLSGEAAASLHASKIDVPLLAIHGTADPLFPIEHGEAFAKVARNARLHRIEGGGHEIHDRDIEDVVSAVASHTAS